MLKGHDGMMDVSPYLSAIQSLNGETPGEKYKDLHSIVATIIASNEEREKFVNTGESELAPCALQPILRILVGVKLKSKDAVVEALKSDDVTIIKLALGAKWFFNACNDLLNVHYFVERVVPFISLRTRLELIKTLSKCLQAQQAESFHREFVIQFGNDQALPLLVACGETYVYDEILTNKMLLSDRMLKDFYRKYPQMVIRYLKWLSAINRPCGSSFHIGFYVNFLPNLLKNHTQEFVEFILGMADRRRMIKLGSTRADYFMRNAAEALVHNPKVFLDWLPLKLVQSKLSKQQYDTMLLNFFPDDIRELHAYEIVQAIKTYYPKDGGFELFRANYETVYGKDLLQHKHLFDSPSIYEVLPSDIKAECSRKYVNGFTDKLNYWMNVYQLPPSESIPLLKEQIKKSTFLQRDDCLRYMLRSCDLYQSKADLLEVLQYYNLRHKNEQALVLLQWLECLSGLFHNMESLEKEHWQIISEIVQRAYIKGDLFQSQCYVYVQRVFDPMLRYFLRQCNTEQPDESDKLFLDKVVNIILECYCEHKMKWKFLTDVPDIEEACLEKFLVAVPQKYPESHVVWKNEDNKICLTTLFIVQMGKFNDRILHAPLDPKVKATKMLIQYYPWLAKFATELFTDKEENTSKVYSTFKKALSKYWPEFYQNLIDEHSDMINDVTTIDALLILKHDRSKISSKDHHYVRACRREVAKGSKFTKHFVMSLKWYQDIPLKFVEMCLAEIEEKGSTLILGLLLEGNALIKILEPYLPKETKLAVEGENAKKDYELVSTIPRAVNFTNPPPPLEALIALCKGDYLSVALQTLSSIAQRLPIDRVLTFTNHLTNSAVSVKKAGIRLVFQVSPKPQLQEFLAKVCREEKNPSIREVVAKMVFEVFTQVPSQDSWQLMKTFIHDLLPDDKSIYDVLKKIKSVHVDYAADYILEILMKINSFKDEELNEKERAQLVLSFLNEIDDKQIFNQLPENVITDIITKYLFDCSSALILGIYLFSDEQKFEDRLKVFIRILSDKFIQMYQPAPECPRLYRILKKIHKRLNDESIYDRLMENQNIEMNRRFITSILEIASVRKDLECFINFNIYQILLDDVSDAKGFGQKCGQNIDDLIKLYNNQLIVEHYGNCLQGIISTSSLFKDQQFDVIDGLMSHQFNYGASIGLKLLSRWSVLNYDERYDKFLETVKNSDDLMAQALLNTFLAGIDSYDY